MSVVIRALNAYLNTDLWRQLQENGMRFNSSWTHSAQNYISTYQKAIECQEGTIQ